MSPNSAARKYGKLYKMTVTIAVLLLGGLGVCRGLFVGSPVATAISQSPTTADIGQVIGADLGFMFSGS
jgi:hypothetical protein